MQHINEKSHYLLSSDNSDSNENQVQKYLALHPLLMKNKVEASHTIASTPTFQKNASLISDMNTRNEAYK